MRAMYELVKKLMMSMSRVIMCMMPAAGGREAMHESRGYCYPAEISANES